MRSAANILMRRALGRFAGVHDLNFDPLPRGTFGLERPEVTHERREDAVRAGDGVRAMEDQRFQGRKLYT